MNNTYVALKNLPLSCFNSVDFEDDWIEDHNVDKVQRISLKMTLINFNQFNRKFFIILSWYLINVRYIGGASNSQS